MKYQEFLQELNRGKVASLYLFSGTEEFLKKEALAKLFKLLVNPKLKDFNYRLLYGKDCAVEDIVDQAQTLPFASQRRLVVVREIEKLTGKEKLLPYLQNPNPANCLVLVTDSLDKRSRKTEFFSTMSKHEVIFYPLFESDLKRWIETKFHEQKKKISAGGIELLIDKVGMSLSNLHSEIEKIFLFLDKKNEVNEAELQKLVFGFAEDNSFKLEKYIGAKDSAKALKVLKDLMAEGIDSSYILVVIANWWRKLITAKEMQHNQCREEEIFLKFNLRLYDHKRNLLNGLKHYVLADLLRKHNKIADTDLLIKSGKRDPLLGLETLMVELCR